MAFLGLVLSWLKQAFSAWPVETMGRDLLLNLAGGFASGVLIFLIARRWDLVLSFLTRERAAFRRIFGARTIESRELIIALDTYHDLSLLPADVQTRLGAQGVQLGGNRFFKTFPDGHVTAFPGATQVLGYCSARGAAYLIDSLKGIRGISVE